MTPLLHAPLGADSLATPYGTRCPVKRYDTVSYLRQAGTSQHGRGARKHVLSTRTGRRQAPVASDRDLDRGRGRDRRAGAEVGQLEKRVLVPAEPLSVRAGAEPAAERLPDRGRAGRDRGGRTGGRRPAP